jgi:hypothetical protein
MQSLLSLDNRARGSTAVWPDPPAEQALVNESIRPANWQAGFQPLSSRFPSHNESP